MPHEVRLSLDEVHALTFAIFINHGVSDAQAQALAAVIYAAERDNCKSHGLFRVPGYMASVKSGKMNKAAEPELSELAPGVLRIDAQNGFAPLALQTGRAPLIARAREQGIAALAIVNSLHFQAVVRGRSTRIRRPRRACLRYRSELRRARRRHQAAVWHQSYGVRLASARTATARF